MKMFLHLCQSVSMTWCFKSQMTTYLDFTITNNLSLNIVIDKCIDKMAAVMAKLNKRVWDNYQLIKHKGISGMCP